MEIAEKEIITQLKCGDERAYRILFDEHYMILCKVAVGFLKDSFLAESIVGDVIFHLWEKRESLDIQTSLRAYLLRSVRNRCINYLEKDYVVKETQMILSDDFLQEEGIFPVSDQYPMATLLEKELEQEIAHSMNKLSQECRTVFEMSRFEDMKYLEIAEKLNISINTVKYHMKNALSRLSEDLGKYLIFIMLCQLF